MVLGTSQLVPRTTLLLENRTGIGKWVLYFPTRPRVTKGSNCCCNSISNVVRIVLHINLLGAEITSFDRYRLHAIRNDPEDPHTPSLKTLRHRPDFTAFH